MTTSRYERDFPARSKRPTNVSSSEARGEVVLSVFDGISCGRQALANNGTHVKTYYAAEIDPTAIDVSKDNWPDIIQLGDVTEWRTWDIDWSSITLFIGGSPCQGFSFLGKQLAFDDPRSKLFFVYVDILKHIQSLNPSVKYMLENVRMKKEHLDVITEKLGVDPIFIDSKVLSAQQRKRYYWANADIPQPLDKGILLKDIIDDGFVGKDKSWCVLESWNRFPKSTESAIGRYKRSMMPIVFATENLDFYEGWRELNANEVERLQTLPVGYCSSVPDKVAKGLLGNGWTVDVISHIFKSLLKVTT